MATATRKCSMCSDRFPREQMTIRGTMAFCCVDHMVQYGLNKGRKEIKKKSIAKKKEFLENDKTFRVKRAQVSFNSYIRKRDDREACISCQRHHEGQYHAGHYRTVGANRGLRFNEDNCHKQCSVCNNHLSGNIADYRINLIKKIGVERVERLENFNEPVKYTCEELKIIELKYRVKLKELE